MKPLAPVPGVEHIRSACRGDRPESHPSGSALAEAASGESALTPEIGRAETVGALGVRLRAANAWTYSLGISYDTKHAFLVHPRLSLKF